MLKLKSVDAGNITFNAAYAEVFFKPEDEVVDEDENDGNNNGTEEVLETGNEENKGEEAPPLPEPEKPALRLTFALAGHTVRINDEKVWVDGRAAKIVKINEAPINGGIQYDIETDVDEFTVIHRKKAINSLSDMVVTKTEPKQSQTSLADDDLWEEHKI